MAPSIFAIGLSGYIGSDVIAQLLVAHPEYQIRALVRSLNSPSTSTLRSHFPSVELVEGTLDSLDLLTSEASTANIVLQLADADHEAGSLALIRGLALGPGSRKGVYIHVSGAANLIDFKVPFGVETQTVVRDSDDAEVVTSLPHDRIHAKIEQQLIAEGKKLGVRMAILSPPQVHGRGRGIKAYGYGMYLDAVVKHGSAFVVNGGENVWGQIHVADLAVAVELLVGTALEPSSFSSAAGWGKKGYYFLEAEEMPFLVQAGIVARLFHEAGLLATAEIDHLSPEEVGKFHQYALIMWGSSARLRAQKLRALGWEPVGPKRERTLETEIEDYIAARA